MRNFNPFDFSGRLSRRQYLGFMLVWLLVFLLFGLAVTPIENFAIGLGFDLLELLLNLLFMVATISYGVRRLHDFDASGWWYLVALIPGVGLLLVIVLLAVPPTPGPNRYGTAAQ